jgi:hypothetical protein
MNRLHRVLIVASAALLPLVGHAAGATPLTRAQVRAELIAAEQNGTYPSSKVHYPDAQPDPASKYVANRAAQQLADEAAADAAYGAASRGTSESGKPSVNASGAGGVRPQSVDIYRGH